MSVQELKEASQRLKDFRMVMQGNNTLVQLKQDLSNEDKEKYKDELESAQQMIEACMEEIKNKK